MIAEVDHNVLASFIGALGLVLAAGVPVMYISLGRKIQNGNSIHDIEIKRLEKRILELEEMLSSEENP